MKRRKLLKKILSALTAIAIILPGAAPAAYAAGDDMVTITYHGNGGISTRSGGELDSVQVQKGSLFMYAPTPEFIYNGADGPKVLSYWAYDLTNKEKLYQDTEINGNTDAYALWLPAITVTFDLNGGTMYGQSVYKENIEKGLILASNYVEEDVVAPSGKKFDCWTTVKDDPNSYLGFEERYNDITVYAYYVDDTSEQMSESKPIVKPEPDEVAPPAAIAQNCTISKKPSKVSIKAGKKGKVTISWSKFRKTGKNKKIWKKIKGIEVQVSTDPEFKTVPIVRILKKGATKLKVKLQKNTKYYVRIRYTDGNNGGSKWTKKKIRTKK